MRRSWPDEEGMEVEGVLRGGTRVQRPGAECERMHVSLLQKQERGRGAGDRTREVHNGEVTEDLGAQRPTLSEGSGEPFRFWAGDGDGQLCIWERLLWGAGGERLKVRLTRGRKPMRR